MSQRNSHRRTRGTHAAWLLLWPQSQGCPLRLLYRKKNPLQDLGLEFPFIKRPPKSVFNEVTKQNFCRLHSGLRGIALRMHLCNNNRTTLLKAPTSARTCLPTKKLGSGYKRNLQHFQSLGQLLPLPSPKQEPLPEGSNLQAVNGPSRRQRPLLALQPRTQALRKCQLSGL